MLRLTIRGLAKGLALIGLVILGGIAYISLNPVPITLQTTNGDAQILFGADHRVVLGPNSCITLSWQVEHIREVYVNGTGVVGSGEKPLCIDLKTQPTLRVVFQDGSEKIYHLAISILLTQPVIWILIVAAMTVLIIAIGLIGAQAIHISPRLRIVVQSAFGIIMALALALTFIEIGLKTYYSAFGTSQERLLYTASQPEIIATLEQQHYIVPAPDVNYVLNPNYQTQNQLGYRGPEIELPKPKGVFRIVTLGDSITYGVTTTADQAYPSQLQQVLRDDYGYTNVEVINAAVIAYTTWDMLSTLSFRVLELEPDLVIIEGDEQDAVARSVTPDCYEGMNPRRGLDPLRQVSIPGAAEQNSSTLYRYLQVNLGWVSDPLQFGFRRYLDDLCQSEDGGSEAEHVQENPPIYFRRNLRDMVAIAQVNHVNIMLSTTAYYHKSNSMLVSNGWWIPATTEANQIILDIGKELNVPAFDLMGNIEQNPDFWFDDGIHVNPKGAREYARLTAAYLVKTGLVGKTTP